MLKDPASVEIAFGGEANLSSAVRFQLTLMDSRKKYSEDQIKFHSSISVDFNGFEAKFNEPTGNVVSLR